MNCKSPYQAKGHHFEARSPNKKVSFGANQKLVSKPSIR